MKAARRAMVLALVVFANVSVQISYAQNLTPLSAEALSAEPLAAAPMAPASPTEFTPSVPASAAPDAVCIRVEGGEVCTSGPVEQIPLDAAIAAEFAYGDRFAAEVSKKSKPIPLSAPAPAPELAPIAELKPTTEQDLLGCLKSIAQKPTCPTGLDRLFDKEARCFAGYRDQAAKAFYQILVDYPNGQPSDKFRQAMLNWYYSYRQRYANCGERAKLTNAIAAALGLETYNCGRKDGDHEFPLVVMNGQVYLVEAWPTTPDESLLLPVTILINGKAAKPPFASLDGVQVVGADGGVIETIRTCNLVGPAAAGS